MTTSDIGNFKYLVVETGYTTRLIHGLSNMKYQLQVDMRNFCKTKEANCSCCNDLVLYIEDESLQQKLYEVSPQKEEIEDIRTMISRKELRGIIVFRCNSFEQAMIAVEVLQDQEYCDGLTMRNCVEIIKINGEVLVMRFNCK